MPTSVARQALELLLEGAERQWSRDRKVDSVLPFTAARFSVYLKLQSRQERDEVHADLRQVAETQTISIDWDSRAGDDGRILRLRCTNADGLARQLGLIPLWHQIAQAECRLASYRDEFCIDAIIETWRQRRRVRNRGPDQAHLVAVAADVVRHCRRAGPATDVPVRALSGRLLGDTKMIEERMVGILDVLTAGDCEAPARSEDEVLSELGLVRFPQPVLVSGCGAIKFHNGDSLPLLKPYMGVPPAIVAALVEPPDFILTVENLTTFNVLAQGAAGDHRGLILYTGGMPSRSMRRAWLDLVASAPESRLLHWGDTDLGGLLIAAVFGKLAESLGRSLHLWEMGCRAIARAPAETGSELSHTDARRMVEIAARHGWAADFDGFETAPRAIEQEIQEIRALADL